MADVPYKEEFCLETATASPTEGDSAAKLLGELWLLHTEQGAGGKRALDADRFMLAQSSLSKALGTSCNKEESMAAYLNLTLKIFETDRSAFAVYSQWQQQRLTSIGWPRTSTSSIVEKIVDSLKQPPATVDIDKKERQLHKAAKEQEKVCRVSVKREELLMAARLEASREAENKDAERRKSYEKAQRLIEDHEAQRETEECTAQKRAKADAASRKKAQVLDAQRNNEADEVKSNKSQRQDDESKAQRMVVAMQKVAMRKVAMQSSAKAVVAMRKNTDVHEAERKAEVNTMKNKTWLELQSRGHHLVSHVFQELVAHGRDAPESAASSISELASYLTRSVTSDEQKAWVLFSWICHHIAYDVAGYNNKSKRKSCTSHDVLKNRVSVCAGYASIYEALAKEAGLEVVTIGGHARNSSRDVGQDIIRDGDGGHAWNAVKLDGQWILLDSTWGAGTTNDQKFHQDFRPHFFGVHPEVLVFTHFPEDSKWQLLPAPVSYQVFISTPMMYSDGFFSHGLRFAPNFRPPGAIVLKSSNQDAIQLQVPSDVELLSQIDNESSKCFQDRQDNGLVTIYFRVPKGPSERKLNIFARKGSEGSYAAACCFKIVGPVQPSRFLEPHFPHVYSTVCEACHVQFQEKLPEGLLIASGKASEASIVLRLPEEMRILTEPDGKNKGVEVKREGVDTTITALPGFCEPQLKVFVGKPAEKSLHCAMTLMVKAVGLK